MSSVLEGVSRVDRRLDRTLDRANSDVVLIYTRAMELVTKALPQTAIQALAFASLALLPLRILPLLRKNFKARVVLPRPLH